MTTALQEPLSGTTLTLLPDEAELSIDDLGERIVGMAGRLAAATCRWLLLVAAFDAREGCARSGLSSTARWLTHCCGLSTRAARDHVRVARTLAAYPTLAGEMTAGRLSYSHVRAIARLAPGSDTARDERLVAELVEVAEAGTVGQLETVVRGLRTVDDIEANDGATDARPPEEYLRAGWTEHSQWQLTARLDPERGAVIDRALDTLAAAEGIRRVDALERLAEIALVVLTDAGRTRDLRGDERAAIVVHLDATTAAEPSTDVAPTSATADAAVPEHHRPGARLAGGPGLPPRVVQRLLCEGRVRTSMHRPDGSMFDLGRSRRVVSRRLFRALLHRDGGCTHPGCGSKAGLEAHHVWHWIDGGRTDLANLVLLCRRHHHTHHDGEFSITAAADGTFVFRRPDGSVLEPRIDPSRSMPYLSDPNAVDTVAPRWTGTGERLDRHYAISVLAQCRYSDASTVRGIVA